MADNTMQILLEVQTIGQETIVKVNNEIAALGKASETQSKASIKQVESSNSLNTSFGKLLPGLKSVQPAMAALGLSALGAATGIGAIGFLAMQAEQSIIKWGDTIYRIKGGIAELAGVENQFTVGPMQDYASITELVTGLSGKYAISLTEIVKAMGRMPAYIRNINLQLAILDNAYRIHIATGMSLSDAVKKLIDVYMGYTYVYDKATGDILLGAQAVNQLTQDYINNADKAIMMETVVRDVAEKISLDFKRYLGPIGGWLGENLVKPMLETIAPLVPNFANIWEKITQITVVWINTMAGLLNSFIQKINSVFSAIKSAFASLPGMPSFISSYANAMLPTLPTIPLVPYPGNISGGIGGQWHSNTRPGNVVVQNYLYPGSAQMSETIIDVMTGAVLNRGGY